LRMELSDLEIWKGVILFTYAKTWRMGVITNIRAPVDPSIKMDIKNVSGHTLFLEYCSIRLDIRIPLHFAMLLCHDTRFVSCRWLFPFIDFQALDGFVRFSHVAMIHMPKSAIPRV
jgi:hypothetical protein